MELVELTWTRSGTTHLFRGDARYDAERFTAICGKAFPNNESLRQPQGEPVCQSCVRVESALTR